MQVYLIRFLNVPPARLPGEGDDNLDDLPRDDRELRDAFLSALDRQGAVKTAGRLVARYLSLGHPVQPLIATLTRAVLREDAEFHTYQMLEAGVQQYWQWGDSPAGHHILIAVARYVAAHSPTERAQLQTAMVARRLNLGEVIHEAQDEEDLSQYLVSNFRGRSRPGRETLTLFEWYHPAVGKIVSFWRRFGVCICDGNYRGSTEKGLMMSGADVTRRKPATGAFRTPTSPNTRCRCTPIRRR